MPKAEDNRRTVVARLLADGWQSAGGAKHEKFVHPDKPSVLVTVRGTRPFRPA